MGLSLGDTVLRLSADGRPLEQGLNKAKGDITAFAGSFGSLTIGGTGLTGALAAGFAGFKDLLGSVKDKVADFFESFKQTKLISDALGIPIGQFQSLKFGAETLGIPIEALNGGLKKFVQNLADARGGDLLAKGTFASIGVAVSELKGLDPGEALKRVADAISQIKDPTDRARAAMSAFGEEGGVKLLPLLSKGAAGLDAFQAEATKLGISFDSVDASKIEEANGAIARVKGSVEGLIQQLAVQLAPVVQTVSQFIVEMIQKAIALFAKFKDGYSNFTIGLSVVAEKLGIVGKGTTATLIQDEINMKRWAAAKEDMDKAGAKGIKVPTVDQGAIVANKKLIEEASGLINQFGPLDSYNRKIQGISLILGKAVEDQDKYAEAIGRASKELIDQTGLNQIAKTPTAFVRGSVDATSAIIKAELSQQVRNDPAQQLRSALAEGKRIQEAQLNTGKLMLDELKRLNDKEPIEVDTY